MVKIKASVTAIVIPSMHAVPAVASAHGQLTRDQVHAELVQLRQAGYHGSLDTQYPADIQQALRRVGAQQQASANAGYGGVSTGSSAAGASPHQSLTYPITNGYQAIYRGR